MRLDASFFEKIREIEFTLCSPVRWENAEKKEILKPESNGYGVFLFRDERDRGKEIVLSVDELRSLSVIDLMLIIAPKVEPSCPGFTKTWGAIRKRADEATESKGDE